MRQWDPVSDDARVEKVLDIPEAAFLNGVTVSTPVSGLLLGADSGLGLIWAVNVHTNEYHVAMQDPTMATVPDVSLQLSVNGLQTRGKQLVYSNTVQASLCEVPFNPAT